jgi:Chaperone for flagella basal body P-ring formation
MPDTRTARRFRALILLAGGFAATGRPTQVQHAVDLLSNAAVIPECGATPGQHCAASPTLREHSACRNLIGRLLSEQQPPIGQNSHFLGNGTNEQHDREIHDGDCGSAKYIGPDAFLELTKDVWDPALRSRVLFVRCLHPEDCLPFLVRLRTPKRESATGTFVARHFAESANPKLPTAVVRAGQRATLIWEKDGIRSAVPVICLDRGAPGERVRVRLATSAGKVLLGVVVDSGILRNPS